jgi:uncharacterized protein YjbI with pentapeptide repeats
MADFTGEDLTGARFRNVDLTGATVRCDVGVLARK